jgi:hypothetical protein
MIGVAAACSVGGGGSAPAPTNISGGSTSNSKVKASLAIKLHIPAASAAASSRSRATMAVRGGRVRPQLISTASNGLSIQGYTTGGVASGQEFDFDISTTSSICSSDGAGGRTCSITITETEGTYYFVVATYASTPASLNGALLSTQPALDSGSTATYTLSPGAISTITVTLGGSVAKISLNVPPSVDGYATSATVPVGVVTYDSAGEVIISSAPYSTPVTIGTATGNSTVALSTLTVTPQSGNGSPSTNGTVTSNYPSDVITLNYAYVATASGAPVGASVSVSASGGSATPASATLSPLFITDSLTQGAPTATAPPGFAVQYPNAGAADTITISEAGSSVSAYAITADPLNGCGTVSSTSASDSNPFLFAYNGGTAVTIPPASVAATGGSGTFTVDTTAYGSNVSGACVYDVADTAGTLVPVSFSTSYTSSGSGQYTANVPGGLLYLTAVQGTGGGAPNAAASPGAVGTLGSNAVLMYAPTAPTTTYQINDPTLLEPLGIAHDLAGDVFVADYSAHVIDEYTPTDIAASPAPVATPYASYTYPNPVPTALAPDGLAFNTKTSTLYVADNGTGYIAELAAAQLLPPGETPQSRRGNSASVRSAVTRPVASTVRAPAARRRALSTTATIAAFFYVGGNPAGIAFDSADDLFVAFPNTDTVSEYAPVDGDTGGGTFTLTPIANYTGTSLPAAIAVASGGTYAGDLYVFESGSATVDIFNPGNIASPATSIAASQNAASAFAVDGSGNLYTTSNANNQIGIIENGGTSVPLGPAFGPTLYIPYATF